jgi:hypothetical protein
MSYTTPSTATTGGTLTTVIWNTQVKDNLNFFYNTTVLQPIGTAIGTAATAGSVYTLGTADSGKLLMCSGTASGTVQIPLNSSQAFATGQKVDLVQMGTGTVTVGTASGVTLRSTPSAILRTQYSAASVIKIGTDEWLLMGDLL